MWGLACFAAFRGVLLAATLPFFTNVDEHRHVDMVLKYARGYRPTPDDAAYEPELPRLLARLGSPEYLLPRERPVPPPPWQAGDAMRERRLAASERAFRGAPNLETFQSPAYYAVAGLWFATLRSLGLDADRSLFAVRALGALGLAGLVLVAAALLRRSHPDGGPEERPPPVLERNRFVRLGVPALIAAAPLDVIAYVTGDSLSLFTGGLAFALLALVLLGHELGRSGHAAAGLSVALAVLTKATSVVLVGVAAIASCASLWERRRAEARGLRREAWRQALLWLALALPLLVWMLRNAALTGGAFGTSAKVAGLGWGVRPWREWGLHPIFSASGAATFLHDLVPIFWRGEVAWHREVLALPAADVFYTASSAVLLGLAVLGLRSPGRDRERRVEGAALLAVLAGVATLAVLSLRFTFTTDSNPSAAHPYFVQGRLLSGLWLPFALLYVRGIEVACRPLPPVGRRAVGWSLLGLVIGVSLGSELWLHGPVSASAYNAFHWP